MKLNCIWIMDICILLAASFPLAILKARAGNPLHSRLVLALWSRNRQITLVDLCEF